MVAGGGRRASADAVVVAHIAHAALARHLRVAGGGVAGAVAGGRDQVVAARGRRARRRAGRVVIVGDAAGRVAAEVGKVARRPVVVGDAARASLNKSRGALATVSVFHLDMLWVVWCRTMRCPRRRSCLLACCHGAGDYLCQEVCKQQCAYCPCWAALRLAAHVRHRNKLAEKVSFAHVRFGIGDLQLPGRKLKLYECTY